MSADAPALTVDASLRGDVLLIGRNIGYEQRAFWRNPQAAIFTFALPVMFLILFASLARGQHIKSLGHINAEQYYIPSILAYGVMSACFSNLAIGMTLRREMGLLKRVRGTPMPLWAYLSAVVGSALVVTVVQVVIALVIGRTVYGVHLPDEPLPFVVALFLGAATFCTLGFAVSSFVPNAEAAPAIVNLPYLVLVIFSGTFYPLAQGTLLAKFVNFFPVSHFIKAMFAPFDTLPGHSPWAWRDLLVVAVWGVVGLLVTVRRFRWEPKSAA